MSITLKKLREFKYRDYKITVYQINEVIDILLATIRNPNGDKVYDFTFGGGKDIDYIITTAEKLIDSLIAKQQAKQRKEKELATKFMIKTRIPLDKRSIALPNIINTIRRRGIINIE